MPAIAAILSLFLGVAGSEYSLSLGQVIEVFVGRDPRRNSEFFLDGYFFVMHTTFIPLALYGVLVIVASWSKVVLSLSRFLLVPENHVNRPYGLVGAVTQNPRTVPS